MNTEVKHNRDIVIRLVDPIIKYQTGRFCKKYCNDNHFLYRCTLPKNPIPCKNNTLPYCEWGNASYGWMLDDLCSEKRLEKSNAETEKQLGNYFFTIANSLPFFERWKNWRFGRRKNVPKYIQSMSPNASKVFLALCNKTSIPDIAQSLGESEDMISHLADKILIELTQRGNLGLLSYPSEVLLSNMVSHSEEDESPAQADIKDENFDPSKLAAISQIRNQFKSLTPAEQFVIESMVVDDFSAKEVLLAIQDANIVINEKKSPEKYTINDVYYFLNKTLAKLKKTLE